MCAAVGHPVARLQRVAFGPLRLGDLGEGHVRRLSPAEVQRLRDAAGPPAPARG
jgi:23S rRNA pseudouridine2605 synthase